LVAFSGDPRYGTAIGYRAATAVAGKFPIFNG